MTDRAPERLGASAALLATAAAVVLLAGSRRGADATSRAAAFHRVTGGLGSGTATTLLPCDAAFDSGVAGPCAAELEPVPGGGAFCPHHSGPTFGR